MLLDPRVVLYGGPTPRYRWSKVTKHLNCHEIATRRKSKLSKIDDGKSCWSSRWMEEFSQNWDLIRQQRYVHDWMQEIP